jgi:hypothetical protein
MCHSPESAGGWEKEVGMSSRSDVTSPLYSGSCVFTSSGEPKIKQFEHSAHFFFALASLTQRYTEMLSGKTFQDLLASFKP